MQELAKYRNRVGLLKDQSLVQELVSIPLTRMKNCWRMSKASWVIFSARTHSSKTKEVDDVFLALWKERLSDKVPRRRVATEGVQGGGGPWGCGWGMKEGMARGWVGIRVITRVKCIPGRVMPHCEKRWLFAFSVQIVADTRKNSIKFRMQSENLVTFMHHEEALIVKHCLNRWIARFQRGGGERN